MTDYREPTRSSPMRVDTGLAQRTLAEKIGQITQVEAHSLTPDDVRTDGIGSVLTGSGAPRMH